MMNCLAVGPNEAQKSRLLPLLKKTCNLHGFSVIFNEIINSMMLMIQLFLFDTLNISRLKKMKRIHHTAIYGGWMKNTTATRQTEVQRETAVSVA